MKNFPIRFRWRQAAFLRAAAADVERASEPGQRSSLPSGSVDFPDFWKSALRSRLGIISGAVFAIAAMPLLAWYWRRVTDRSDEPLGVIALMVAVMLVVARGFHLRERQHMRLHPLRLLFGAAVLALVQVTPLAHFPLASGLIAVATLGFSWNTARGKSGTVALLVLSLPLVASLDFYVGYPMRLAASYISGFLLNLFGLGVERSGVLLLDQGSVVGMDPPCAGVRMLWTSCFTAAVVAVRHRLPWQRTVLLIMGAVLCVVLGNGVRAALVYLPESGHVHWPEWMHPGVGLVVHGGVLAAVFALGEYFSGRHPWASAHFGGLATLAKKGLRKVWSPFEGCAMAACRGKVRRGLWATLALAVIGAAAMRRLCSDESYPQAMASKQFVSWPATLDGTPLVPMPLSIREERFVRSFPGRIAKFRCGDAEVILRSVASATRFLHPSSDCLRAAGFAMTSKPVFQDADRRMWGCSHAERGSGTWRVRERYVNAAGTRVCTDASAWYWEAMLHPGEGPWMAVTIMERLPAENLLAGK